MDKDINAIWKESLLSGLEKKKNLRERITDFLKMIQHFSCKCLKKEQEMPI